MSPVFRGRVTVPEEVLVRELGGESVVLNLRSESYFGLDDVGTRMWAALTASPSMEDAYRMLADEYEVEPALLRADLLTFIEKLSAAGLIHVAEG